jgi:hypothetical protein
MSHSRSSIALPAAACLSPCPQALLEWLQRCTSSPLGAETLRPLMLSRMQSPWQVSKAVDASFPQSLSPELPASSSSARLQRCTSRPLRADPLRPQRPSRGSCTPTAENRLAGFRQRHVYYDCILRDGRVLAACPGPSGLAAVLHTNDK